MQQVNLENNGLQKKKNNGASGNTSVFEALTYHCPKCAQPYVAGKAECSKCGLIFLKFQELEKNKSQRVIEKSFSPSPELRELWEEVINNYENKETHQNFISAAWSENLLEYAGLKYKNILSILPSDEIALMANNEIQSLSLVKFESYTGNITKTDLALAEEDLGASMKSTLNHKYNFQIPIHKFKITYLIYFFCGIVITTGMFMPHMRNLIGFGTSILFFVVALRYYFRAI
jgi:uncharacterized Zn finger protein (UPF0148 family)